MKGLFGMFDHEIPLNQESRITIIYGPNGVGKTVLMRMVHGLFHYGYKYIDSIPFEEMRIEFERGKSLSVESNEAEKKPIIRFCDNAGRNEVPYQPKLYNNQRLIMAAEQRFPDFTLLKWDGRLYWADPTELSGHFGIYFLLRECRDRKTLFDQFPDFDIFLNGPSPDWFSHIKKSIRVQFLETERLRGTLLKGDGGDDVYWDDYDDGVHLSGLAPAVRDLEIFFPSFVENTHPADEDLNILQNLKELAETEKKMASSDIDDPSMAEDLDYDRFKKLDEIRAVIERRLQSNAEYQRLKLFQDIVNDRFIFKSLEFHGPKTHDVFGFLSEDGSWLKLEDLSSGEQHLLILYYRLLFEIEPDTLVMIDEPELSMNVVWQRNFLKDLQRIIELRNFDVLIATHSPQIIHDKWDWMVPLGEKMDD